MSSYASYYRRRYPFAYRAKHWILKNSVKEIKRGILILGKIVLTILWFGAFFLLPHFFH